MNQIDTSKIDQDILDNFEYLKKVRRYIHSHPEVGPEQPDTVKYVKEQFSQLNDIVITEGDAKAGVVIDIICKNSGPTVAFRADMDALNIEESSSKEHFPRANNFCSVYENKMHACGHDTHTAILLCFGKIIYNQRAKLKGKIRLLFQPGEEGFGGAAQMVKAGYLDGVQNVFALHSWPNLKVGQIGFRKGPFFASNDQFSVEISGIGGHAAAPEKATDQILAASRIINDLQSIISRRIGGLEQAVLSITYIKAGSSKASNVIPSTARFGGSIRTFSHEIQDMIEEEFKRVCVHSAQSVHPDCKVEIKYKRIYPQTINDDKLALKLEDVFLQFLDKKDLFTSYTPTLGAEDFSFMIDKVPGVLFLIGATKPQKSCNDTVFLHNPSFDVDEKAMLFGVQAFKKLALEFLT